MKFTAAILLLLFIPLVTAHGGGHGEEVGAGEYEISLVNTDLRMNEEAVLEVHVVNAEGEAVSGEATFEILREEYAAEETEPGVYILPYTFEKFGDNEVIFRIDDELAVLNVPVGPAQGPPIQVFMAFLAIVVLGVAAVGVSGKVSPKTTAVAGATALLILLTGYFTYLHEPTPLMQGCLMAVGDKYALHCHQELHLSICGEEKQLPEEYGPLDRGHTHRSDAKVHWHPPDLVSDPGSVMTLRNLFADFGLALNATAVEDPETGEVYRNGEMLCGEAGELSVFVMENGERLEIEDFLDYPLEDGMVVEVLYK